MMDLGLHGMLGFTAARLTRLGWAAMLGALVGGMLPDIWSHIPNIPKFFSGEKPYTYDWYHFPHSVHGVMVMCAVTALVGVWAIVKGSKAAYAFALLMLLGFAAHVGVDELWHKPGGGWYPWGFWANVGGWALVLWLNLPWLIGILRNQFSKGE